ncbi:hypothetical protein PQR64_35750 [Paraburkholderia phytofirmans]|uniref:hypothetical protein n=1 Tax=Paraburkholderia phytofirmans TaxID=261302 RepID=UPI0038BB8434
MTGHQCLGFVCFVSLSPNDPKFFGFAEYLASLALMVLAWTTADVRYQFRVRTAPVPLIPIAYGVVAGVGALTLLTDLWRAAGWLVPNGHLLTPEIWQALLGLCFLATFLVWAWFAFVCPQKYGRSNYRRYGSALYRIVLKGAPSELAIIADEMTKSIPSLIRYATEFDRHDRDQVDRRTPVSACADDLLLLIADKRFCRAVVESSPDTALALFQAIAKTSKYRVQVGTFARNLVSVALANPDSFLFHEGEGYETGFLGYYKPLTQAIFGNYHMVEAIDTPLDAHPEYSAPASQWKAYCRVAQMTFSDYVKDGSDQHSFILFRALGFIKSATMDLYVLDKSTSSLLGSNEYEKLRTTMSFVESAIAALDGHGVPAHLKRRVRENDPPMQTTFYDHLAEMIFEVIFHASHVQAPASLCWSIQHNCVWGELFNFNRLNTPAGKVIKFKLRRLLYDEIVRMEKFENFKGAKILAFCLNVMGISTKPASNDRDSWPLKKAVLSWTKRSFSALYANNSRVGQTCLVDSITYDEQNCRLVKTYPLFIDPEPRRDYFDLDPAPVRADQAA